jgi:ABC-type sugar transport system ATPase subunit
MLNLYNNLREVFAVSDKVVVVRLGEAAECFKTSEEQVLAAVVGARVRAT